MAKNQLAIMRYRPLEDNFIVPEIKTRETLPALRTPTRSTSLVLYEKRLPSRYFISGRIIEVAIAKKTEFAYDPPEGKDGAGYDPQGRLLHQGRKGLRIDTYI